MEREFRELNSHSTPVTERSVYRGNSIPEIPAPSIHPPKSVKLCYYVSILCKNIFRLFIIIQILEEYKQSKTEGV